MLDRLAPQSPDALLALIKLYAADPRSDKIDLGVGVYRTGKGDTPVFAAIKAAEAKLVAEQDSKSYLGPEGDLGFVHALMPYIFGKDATKGGRIEGMQTPGGTGAVRLAVAVAQKAGITAVHMGVPSWPNHAQILADISLDVRTFDHAQADGSANLDNVLAAIRNAQDGEAGARRLLSRMLGEETAAQPGAVALIGAGPGDPDLLTLRARTRLHDADVVIHDPRVDPRILELARREAQFIPLEEIAAADRADRHAQAGALVAWLVPGAGDGALTGTMKTAPEIIPGVAIQENAAALWARSLPLGADAPVIRRA